jgi:hypothetical protein
MESREIAMNKLSTGLMALALAVIFAGAAEASSVNSVAVGNVFSNTNTAGTTSYTSPSLIVQSPTRANYMIFSVADLTASLGGQLAGSATLTFNAPGSISSGTNYSLWSFEGSGSSLLANTAAYNSSTTNYIDGATGAAFLADLSSGTSYGSTSLTTAAFNTPFSITLTSDAVNGINNAIGSGALYFVIGGSTTGSAFEFTSSTGGTGAPTAGASLSVSAVPLPAGLWLLGSGLAGLGALRRRKLAA